MQLHTAQADINMKVEHALASELPRDIIFSTFIFSRLSSSPDLSSQWPRPCHRATPLWRPTLMNLQSTPTLTGEKKVRMFLN